jgi:hypothetical protein
LIRDKLPKDGEEIILKPGFKPDLDPKKIKEYGLDHECFH